MRDPTLNILQPCTRQIVDPETAPRTYTSKISDQDYRSLIYDFNDNDDPSFLGARLDQLFEKVSRDFPENIALIHGDRQISFKELNVSANILARCLQKRGLSHGDVAGLAVSRSIDLVVTMLAVLKLGAAYVPIDPSFPAQRIDHMIEDANPKLILLSDAPTKGLSRWEHLCLSVYDAGDVLPEDTMNLHVNIGHQELAYVIYTSGSTGRPKGVEISHGAAANFLSSLRSYEPGCSEHDRLLAITTISFDMSALELLLPILSGATMVIANPSAVRDPRELVDLMLAHQITMLQATPATWTMLLESGWQGTPRLSKIICGGEPLSRHLADRLLALADTVWNVYGPSETTYGSVGRVGTGDIVVGNPMINGRIYLLNDDLSPVPIGSEGEVYIGGGSVSNGYRNKPELTQSRFLENPFHGGKFFRTGDRARFLGPGKLQVIGRIDGVVKVRGYRVDTGDIEAVLVDHPDVSAAVVISRDDRLVAYCVARTPSHDIASLDTVLRPWVAERLPSYMVPAFFVPMHVLPLSPNEKVNRNALPDPIKVLQSLAPTQPTSDLEQQIQAIWSEVLGHTQFGMNDSFFSIGGDSMRIIRMQAALEKRLLRTVPTPKLFEHFTIEALAAYLSGTDKKVSNGELALGLDSNNEDIAIVSMSCRLPGGVATPEDLWEVLLGGGDSITDIPKDRWDAERLYNADPSVDGTSYCRRGGFADSIGSYDAPFFGISPREARMMDPEQHLMLELCWEGFERAGYTRDKLSGTSTAVFMGVSKSCATDQGPPELKGHSITGSANATLSGRLSYTFDLQGPSLTIDTACSSSLVATHLACNTLRHGECNMALVGGVSLLLNPAIHIEFSKLRGLSSDGRCRAFSEDTDGTGFSEGGVVVLLKRLSDAQRDGDDIQGVIRGTAVMHGGHSASLTAPSGPRQETLIRTALARTALEPESIDYVEAHGTATKLGDPIEATALAEVFSKGQARPGPLRIGSVKSNLGHTQAAAGLVGLLKVVLSMRNGCLPKTLHVKEPSRAIDWKTSNLELVMENQEWLPCKDRLRRAGVSAFGIGGTIAHAVVEEFPTPITLENGTNGHSELPDTFLFLLSGNNDAAVRAQAEKLRVHIEQGRSSSDRLADVAYSLATSRTHLRRRLAVKGRDKSHLLEQLTLISAGSEKLPDLDEAGKASLGMLFTGQGSQQPQMGKALYTIFPVFRDALNEIAAEFNKLDFPLLDIMWAVPGSSIAAALMERTDFAQPALFALEVSLWRLWQAYGVKPAYLLGHSVGELAVAHVAGILNLADACRFVSARGCLMQAVSRLGKSVAVEASGPEVEAMINTLDMDDTVQVASYNTPSQTVFSGDHSSVEAIESIFQDQGLKCKVLNGSHAFHSCHMDEMLEELRAVAQTLHFHPPTMPIVSSMTGKVASAGELEHAEYWVQQIRNAVRFSDAFEALSDQGTNILLELGPNSTLCGLGAANLAASSPATSALWLPSLKSNTDGHLSIVDCLGKLHERGFSINWQEYFKPFGCRRVTLPTYAFQREGALLPTVGLRPSAAMQASGADQDMSYLARIMFDVNWRPIESGSANTRGRWGVLCPSQETAWTNDVQAELQVTGVQLVPITNVDEAAQLDGLLSLWDSELDVVQTAHEMTAKGLTQLQEIIGTGYAAPVVWVVRHALGVGEGDQLTGIGASPLVGLMRTARSEHPELRLRLIDVDDVTHLATLGSALTLEASNEIAIRKNCLLAPNMERTSTSTTASRPSGQPLLRVDGPVLVTGGLGDIGSRLAQRLAKDHGVRDLILLSRRGLDSPGAEAVIAKLADLGAKTTVIAADMATAEGLRDIAQLLASHRPLRGVIHAAGVVDSGTITSLTPQKCATTFAPKVDGLWNLHQLTKDMDLDIFVMLSSISGVMGLPGLGNYAAANCFIDALAYMRRAQGLPATSMAYGTWDGEGMITTLVSTTRAHLAQFGLGLLSPEAGIGALEQAIYQRSTLVVAAELDVQQLKVYYQSQGQVPPFLRSMIGQTVIPKPLEKAVTLRDLLVDASPEQHSDIVLRMVQATVAKVLEYSGIDELDATRPLQDFGFDSLTAVLMRNNLATLTGVALPPNIALLYPTMRSLSNYLLARLLDDLEKPTTIEAAARLVDMTAIRRGVLDTRIQFSNVSLHENACYRCPESVLVTGPTGFVGAFMVHEFLTRGIAVHCLVRASSSSQAQERMVTTLKQYGLWKPDYESLLHPVVGDLSQPLLGLREEEFNSLADKIDAILHSGALVDWLRPLEDYIGPNVLGTHEILRLASRGRAKAVHYISTISTLPIHLGYGLTEDDTEYGYGTSKYLAERMVVAARFRGALTTSYRLPFVAASANDGQFRLDRGDFLHNLIAGSLDLGAFPIIDADMSAVLPVDYLSSTIARIMTEDRQWAGEDYDLINPKSPNFEQFFKTMGTIGGIETIPFGEWHARALEFAANHPQLSLARITAVIDGYTDETAGDLVKGSPVGKHVFGKDFYPAPALGEEYVDKYLKCIIARSGEHKAVAFQ